MKTILGLILVFGLPAFAQTPPTDMEAQAAAECIDCGKNQKRTPAFENPAAMQANADAMLADFFGKNDKGNSNDASGTRK